MRFGKTNAAILFAITFYIQGLQVQDHSHCATIPVKSLEKSIMGPIIDLFPPQSTELYCHPKRLAIPSLEGSNHRDRYY
jgi:hypothetical protein